MLPFKENSKQYTFIWLNRILKTTYLWNHKNYGITSTQMTGTRLTDHLTKQPNSIVFGIHLDHHVICSSAATHSIAHTMVQFVNLMVHLFSSIMPICPVHVLLEWILLLYHWQHFFLSYFLLSFNIIDKFDLNIELTRPKSGHLSLLLHLILWIPDGPDMRSCWHVRWFHFQSWSQLFHFEYIFWSLLEFSWSLYADPHSHFLCLALRSFFPDPLRCWKTTQCDQH